MIHFKTTRHRELGARDLELSRALLEQRLERALAVARLALLRTDSASSTVPTTTSRREVRR